MLGDEATEHHPLIVVGAGPAGLAAAYEAVRRGLECIVLEKAPQVGGLARTETYNGYRFDVGGHRFFTRAGEVLRLWQEMLGEELIRVPRQSSIYYRGRLINYPLELLDTLSKLGPAESILILLSYLRARLRPFADEQTFEHWAIDHFGRRLYEIFFRSYTEKVWGMPCSEIQADWAAQRIEGLSVSTVVSNALRGTNRSRTLIREFHYPTLGPGMMWQRFCQAVESHGSQVRLGTEVVRLERNGRKITGVVTAHGREMRRIASDHVISSAPLDELLAQLDPPAPDDAARAAQGLRHRAFILVGLVVNRARLFPDQWIYVHSPKVQVGRIQSFGNWSAAMTPDARKTSLGLEYFCARGDSLWTTSDAALIEMATSELAHLKLAEAGEVADGVVFRQPYAYPVYDRDYREHLATIRRFLATIENLQTIGRSGLHRYNNMDHSMLTGMLAVRNLSGEEHDLWQVNADTSYHEEAPGGQP